MRPVDQYFLSKDEPEKGCLLALRTFILAFDEKMVETWKYRMPCYCYGEKTFCYLWTDRKTGEPYILFVEGRKLDHPRLEQGNRARMKILRIDAKKDIPMKLLHLLFKSAREFYV